MLKCSFLKNLATLTKYNEARTLKLFFKKTRLEYFPVERLYNIEYREMGGSTARYTITAMMTTTGSRGSPYTLPSQSSGIPLEWP